MTPLEMMKKELEPLSLAVLASLAKVKEAQAHSAMMSKRLEERKNEFLKLCPEKVYGYTATSKIVKESRWPEEAPPGTEIIKLCRETKNLTEIEDFLVAAGSCLQLNDKEKEYSLSYYRVKVRETDDAGILMSCSGGTYMLRNAAVVTDADWELLKTGVIPAHLKYVSCPL